ncbi:MAG: hypothetical protein IIW98_07445 [Bacteroidaceae bacterium]|nr:hypothetical protein [Bacteroidaceae bacterium]
MSSVASGAFWIVFALISAFCSDIACIAALSDLERIPRCASGATIAFCAFGKFAFFTPFAADTLAAAKAATTISKNFFIIVLIKSL